MPRKALLAATLLLAMFLAACSGKTTPATNVTSSAATLNAAGSCDTNETVTWYWKYGRYGADPATFAKTATNGPATCGGKVTGAPLHADVTGLTPSTTYLYQICGTSNGNGPVCAGGDGADKTYTGFTTQAPPPSGFSPTDGLYLTRPEIDALPITGAAWDNVHNAAVGTWPAPNLADQVNRASVYTLAGALVSLRTQDASLRRKTADAINAAIGTEAGARSLALGRTLPSYVLAADLIDLKSFDPTIDQRFRGWLTQLPTETLSGPDLLTTSQDRPSNWGTNARNAMATLALYLHDTGQVTHQVQMFQGWLGDRAAYASFVMPSDGTANWVQNPFAPQYVVPADGVLKDCSGTVVNYNFSGALSADMVRNATCPSNPAPSGTDYPWAGLAPAISEGWLLQHAGYGAKDYSAQALKRAIDLLYRLSRDTPGWVFPQNAQYRNAIYIANRLYGTTYPVSGTTPDFHIGWADWTHGP